MAVPFPYVIERAYTLQSAWLHQNVGFSLYIPDCEACRQTGPRCGRLTIIAEVQATGAGGRCYRAALCRCDCGKQAISRISSLVSGDAQSCGCSRGQLRYEQKHCPVCGVLAMIRRDHRSCSRACGYELARAARQAAEPSYDVWRKRVTQARGPASGYACVDCGKPAQD